MESIVEAIKEVQEEPSLPKMTKQKLDEIITILQGPGDKRLKVSKALSEIEELSDGSQLPSFVRSQLWNIASLLETM